MSEEVNAVQENTTVEQDDSAVDYKNLYLNEVQNAKKLRKRAQDSEGSLQEFQKQREAERVKSLEEQGKYKEMYEDIAGKYEEALAPVTIEGSSEKVLQKVIYGMVDFDPDKAYRKKGSGLFGY